MVRSDSKFRKGSKFDGMAKDNSHQAEITRGSSEGEPIIGHRPPETVSQIAEGLGRFSKGNKR